MNYNGYDTEEDQEYYRSLRDAPRFKRGQRLEEDWGDIYEPITPDMREEGE